jgi:hypothetical protein
MGKPTGRSRLGRQAGARRPGRPLAVSLGRRGAVLGAPRPSRSQSPAAPGVHPGVGVPAKTEAEPPPADPESRWPGQSRRVFRSIVTGTRRDARC